jgi:hypothetical protein
MPVRARDAVVNDDEPGSVQKSAPRESQIGVHIQAPLVRSRKSLALLGTQRVLPLTLDISRGRQFGPRWRESDSAQHEDHLKHEQQEVHDRSPVPAG